MESHTTWLIFYNLSARCFCCLAAQVPATVVVQTCQRLRTHTDLLAAVQTCLHTNAGIHMCTRTSICAPTHGRQWLSGPYALARNRVATYFDILVADAFFQRLWSHFKYSRQIRYPAQSFRVACCFLKDRVLVATPLWCPQTHHVCMINCSGYG